MSSTEPQPKPQRRPYLRFACWSALLAGVVLTACGGKSQQDADSTAPAAGGMGAGGSIGSGGANKGAATSATGVGTGGGIGSGGTGTGGTPSADAGTADSGVGACSNDALFAALRHIEGLVWQCWFANEPVDSGTIGQLTGTILFDGEGRAVAGTGSGSELVNSLTAAGWSCPASAGSTYQIWCFGGGD